MPHSFTPGPWEALEFSQHELQTDFAMVKIGKRVHMIGYSDEDKANAQLIAAAPDLLEALRGMRNAFIGTSVEVQAEAMRAARAAINKAVGQS